MSSRPFRPGRQRSTTIVSHSLTSTALAERAGLSLAQVSGEEINIKLTTAKDFTLAERLAGSALSDIRTGTGFDVHRFGSRRRVDGAHGRRRRRVRHLGFAVLRCARRVERVL